MSATPARVAALDTLRAVREGDLADRALARFAERVPARDTGWTRELVYGTFRLRGRLDHYLDHFTRRGIASLVPDVLDVLRLGAYQLLEMTSVPVYAAVSQSVELAKRAAGRGGAGLVNGVLHSLAREQDRVEFPEFSADPVGHLTTWGSHPAWLVERWVEGHGPDGARRLVEANNRRPGVYLRPVRVTAMDARSALESGGIGVSYVEGDPDMLRLDEPVAVGRALSLVSAVVQDPAAARVARFAMPEAGARMADLCAAPGGKALGIAGAQAGPPKYVVAAEVSWERLGRLRENVLRLAPLPVGLVVADARQPAVRPVEHVLLDVPCTGTGTLARHPDGRWRLREEDLESLVGLQREMLRAAADRVAPGGTLVYATCSIEPEENERQVEGFLQDRDDFAVEAPAHGVGTDLDARGCLRVLPAVDRYDGAFAARMRRHG